MMGTLEDRAAAEAMRAAVEDYARRDSYVTAYDHEDGSVTVLMYDPDPLDPREDYDHTTALVADGNDRMNGPAEGDALAEARDRWHPSRYVLSYGGGWRDRYNDRPTPAPVDMLRRYVAMFRPEIVHVGEWTVTGHSQGDWQSGYGYVTRAAWVAAMGAGYAGDTTPADIFRGEVEEYAAYWAGEVYGAVHLTLGAPVVAYGEHGAYVDGYDVDEDGPVWGFIGYNDRAEIAGTFTDSPVTGERDQ